MKKNYLLILLFFLLCIPTLKVNAKNINIVIDPGHGGDNLGGLYQDFTEKELTMETAIAMKEHLEQFENVTVYLTHENTSDADLSLLKRAEIAFSVNADFLFSLHYNKSSDNRLFGAEVWVSAFDDYYARGMQFAQIEMQQLADYGLFDRGIKTRLNSRGTDYYGIIQHAREFNIPCVIIEHCHMDQAHDIPFLTKENACKEFGRLDAEAVARYFNLKSSTHNEDYSSYQKQEIAVPSNVMKPDLTPPDAADIALMDSTNTDMVSIMISACDTESGLNYYDYSIDGGQTYSDLQPWPFDSPECSFELPVSTEYDRQLICRVYNRYDRLLESNTINIEKAEQATQITDTSKQDSDAETPSKNSDDDSQTDIQESKSIATISYQTNEQNNSYDMTDYILFGVLICAFLFFIFNILFFTYLIKGKKRKRKNKSKQ